MLNPYDFIIETYNSGSSWFPRFNGIKLTHKPTGIIVFRNTERSAHSNRNRAWEDMKELLKYETDLTEQMELF